MPSQVCRGTLGSIEGEILPLCKFDDGNQRFPPLCKFDDGNQRFPVSFMSHLCLIYVSLIASLRMTGRRTAQNDRANRCQALNPARNIFVTFNEFSQSAKNLFTNRKPPYPRTYPHLFVNKCVKSVGFPHMISTLSTWHRWVKMFSQNATRNICFVNNRES